eukprot:COSAG01_NODE_3805_length_5680_cov_7.949292_4_plen_119_part_00
MDAHFQKVNAAIQDYVDEAAALDEDSHKVCTADQIVTAVTANEGLPATDIALIQLDRIKLDQLDARREKLARTIAILLPGQILDIRYSADTEQAETAHQTIVWFYKFSWQLRPLLEDY